MGILAALMKLEEIGIHEIFLAPGDKVVYFSPHRIKVPKRLINVIYIYKYKSKLKKACKCCEYWLLD